MSLASVSPRAVGNRRLVTACLLLAGCAATPPPVQAPLPPLQASVDATTVRKLAEFATVTRVCREIFNRQVKEDIADFFRKYPDASIYPTGHGVFWRYKSCVMRGTASPCDATASDLGSVRSLLREDPRLASLMSFEQLLAERDAQCSAQPGLLKQIDKAQSHDERAPRNCEAVWGQPVLTTLSASVHSPTFTYQRTRHNCGPSLGYTFLEEHCRAITNGRRPKPYSGVEWSTDELGIEEYLCPPMASDVIPKQKQSTVVSP